MYAMTGRRAKVLGFGLAALAGVGGGGGIMPTAVPAPDVPWIAIGDTGELGVAPGPITGLPGTGGSGGVDDSEVASQGIEADEPAELGIEEPAAGGLR